VKIFYHHSDGFRFLRVRFHLIDIICLLMPDKYYVDTSIFIDYIENRADSLRPLGEWAHRLLAHIAAEGGVLLVSDVLERELVGHGTQPGIDEISADFGIVVKRLRSTTSQCKEAASVAKARKVPLGDALHAVMARDEGAILITRDRHFHELCDIAVPYAPEQIT
jgi:predicted nucleic acid-binding protein